MTLLAKILRYPAIAYKHWSSNGLQGVLDDLTESLREHLGIRRLEAQFQHTFPLVEQTASVVSSWVVMSWIEQATLVSNPLVSVILPTHNRASMLPRAIDSVVAQFYSNWEIVLTDDGSTDNTPKVLDELRAKLGVARLNAERASAGGVCAARNHALARARGEFVVYLDDDNVMHPLWLKAVVWAFSQFPDKEVAYGGCVVDDVRRMNGKDAGDLPVYNLMPFDRNRLMRSNFIDIGQVAHRRVLPEARFDEKLAGVGDWDLLLRMTRDRDPLVIPAIATFYSTNAANRLSCDPAFYDDIDRVRNKLGKLSAKTWPGLQSLPE